MDTRKFLTYDLIEGVDYDPNPQPTAEEIAAMADEFACPGECPNCGGWDIAHEPADPSVGILADSHYCEDCGWEVPA